MKPLRLAFLCCSLVAGVSFAQRPDQIPTQPRKKQPEVKTPKAPTPKAKQEELKRAAEEADRSVPRKFTWDIPEIIETVEVPGIQQGLGTPVKLHAVRTRWKLDRIMDFMAREFEKAKLYIPPPHHLTRLSSDPQLHGFDPFRKIGFSVIFQPNRDGTTTLILGEAHVSEAKPLAGQYFAPVFPDAQGVIQSQQEGMTVLAYSTASPQAEVLKFYAELLPRQGYQQLSASKFRKGNEQVVVSYYQPNAGLGSSVVLTRGPYQPDGQVDMSKSPAEVTR